jgi:hypothetical protein
LPLFERLDGGRRATLGWKLVHLRPPDFRVDANFASSVVAAPTLNEAVVLGPFHVRRIEVFDPDSQRQASETTSALSERRSGVSRDLLAGNEGQELASREWIFEIADASGQTVLAMPFESAIKLDGPDPDQLTAENDG